MVLCSIETNAQDTIVLRDASEIEAKVVEITGGQVSYKKWNYQDGPTFHVEIDRIYNILFANGDKLFDYDNKFNDAASDISVTDIDGNIYSTVKIGDQIWMASNLKVKHFNDGSDIPLNQGIASEKNPLCYELSVEDTDFPIREAIGLYYNFAAVIDQRGLCPEGWHVPSDEDWKELSLFLKGRDRRQIISVGKALASKEYWKPDRDEGTVGFEPNYNNLTLFTAYPMGSYRMRKVINIGEKACFWSSSQDILSVNNHQANGYFLEHDETDLDLCRRYVTNGFSVRCIRNHQ